MTAATHRDAARVLLVDARDRVLLLKWTDPSRPDRGTWWITPGGGLDPGEEFADGALRELFEETGLLLTSDALVGPVLEREIDTEIDGRAFTQHERFFVAHIESHEVETSGHTELELACLVEHRWWSRDELGATAERLSPANLLELLETVA